MHPLLFKIGSFPVPTYGAFAVLALICIILVIRRYARIEGRDPSQTTDAIVLTVAVAFLGARAMEVAINGRTIFSNPDWPRILLSTTGVFYGALLTAIPFGIWYFRRVGLPMLQGLDILGLVAATADGVGRWGCFFSGCCWGTPTDLPWAVTFPPIARRIHAGLPDVPLHPTQIYLSLNSLAILGLLMLAYRRKRFHGQILCLYVLLYAVTRFLLEQVRGDAERGFLFGGLLSTSQFLAIVTAALAVLAWVALDRRHRRAHEPDWSPTAALAPSRGRR